VEETKTIIIIIIIACLTLIIGLFALLALFFVSRPCECFA